MSLSLISDPLPKQKLSSDENDAPKILENLITQAEKASCTDVHLQTVANSVLISFRIDGVIVPISKLEGEVSERLLGRIKYLAQLKTYQNSLPQDGRIIKSSIGSREDIRVATYPTVTGEKIVLRFFQNASNKKLRELNFPDLVCADLESALKQSSGLILLTGPAGSGKTTLIYACLRYLTEKGGRHIITIEDPVEQIIPGIMQTEINEACGLTFAKSAKHLLRQDPQVLVIGEIRDEETANIAVRAALTGHLVISTLHAGSCCGVFERLQTMCPDSYVVASVTELVLNQRLLRRTCPDCTGSGCSNCFQTGYKGSVPAVESMRMTETLREALRMQNKNNLKPQISMEEAARNLLQTQQTNQTEYQRIFGHELR
jgi:general secretion pathway protein E